MQPLLEQLAGAPLRVPYGTGSAGRAVVERQVVLIEDIAVSPHYGAFAAKAVEHGVHTVLSVPMLTLNGEPMGALSTYYRSHRLPPGGDHPAAVGVGGRDHLRLAVGAVPPGATTTSSRSGWAS